MVHNTKSKRTLWANLGPLAVVTVVLVLIIVGVVHLWHQSRIIGDIMISQEVTKLQKIFKRIDETCGIIGFEHERNYIDFLTVKAFVGSEVGAMNLARPDKWEGPYANDNPTIQERLFEIVRTAKGYYIVPGQGVKLNNGMVMGKSLNVAKDDDIERMIIPGGPLNFDGNALAARLDFKLLAVEEKEGDRLTLVGGIDD